MTRSLSIALIAIALSATLYGQQTSDRRTLANLLEGGQDSSGASGATTDSSKLSPAVKKILDEAVDEVKKNRQAFDKANEKPVADARVKLQDLAKALVDEGKAEEATAVLGQIKTLDADVMRLANSLSPVPAGVGGRPAPRKPLLERLEGKWDRDAFGDGYIFYKNGTGEARRKADGRVTNKSRCQALTDESGVVEWDSGHRWIIRVVGDDWLAIRETKGGEATCSGIILLRMK